MNRTFTTREKILMIILAVLLVGCFYYLVVLKPSLDTLSSSDSQYASLQDQILVQQTIASKKASLQKQIDEAQASGVSQKTLPTYDNTKNEIAALNTILAEASTYSISFADAQFSDALVRRVVSISFTSASYSDAQAVLNKLINCEYSCLVTDVTLTGDSLGQSSGGEVKASASVTFFESLK